MSAQAKAEVQVVESNLLPVNKQAVDELKKQRDLLAKFVKSQLIEANFEDKNAANYGEGDFGKIPGTKKNSLFKSGAEKLLRLFGLGVRFRQVDKEIDRHANFALYTYRAEVYVMKTGSVIADCEATVNSQEVKYKERTEWRKNAKGIKEAHKVDTPIYDVLNTLQKMAQKRALVGATLLATGASEYFTQDMVDAEEILDVTPESPKGNSAPKNVTPKEETEEAAEDEEPPICCGKAMMISKYVDPELGHAPWYCISCKKKRLRE